MKKLLISISLVLVSLTAVMFGGCGLDRYRKDPWEYKKEQNGFYYFLVGKNEGVAGIGNKADYAVIIGYKNTNEIIDELVIPEKLGGYPVKLVGYAWQPRPLGPYNYYGIKANGKIRKVVINYDVYVKEEGLQGFNGLIIINNADAEVDWDYFRKCSIELNVETSAYDYILNHALSVKFDAVGGKQKTYYRVVSSSDNYKCPAPEPPTKEGFTFDGWYTDDQYGTKWNFEQDEVTQNMTLYAKWI